MEKITLLYGTGNAGKLAVMKKYLESMEQVELIGLKDLPFVWEEPEESGRNPLENARQKALGYYRICHMPVFSVDSGLFIEGLSDEEQPGVHVRRVGGKNLTDEEMKAHYKRIAVRFGGKCTAQYRNGICLVFSEDEIYESQDEGLSWEKFYLTTDERPQKLKGFPLDAISVDIRTGRHFYDDAPDFGVENDGSSFCAFFAEALMKHREAAAVKMGQTEYRSEQKKD